MSRSDRRSARAAARNAKRQAESEAAVASTISPEEAQRLERRRAQEAKREAEFRRAKRLSETSVDPAPDNTVLGYLNAAEVQRQLARNLDPQCERIEIGGKTRTAIHGPKAAAARRDRKAHLEKARVYELQAARARANQLAAFRSAVDQVEIAAQAHARGDKLETVETAVSDWARDEHGAIVKEEGLPVLLTETAFARKRTVTDLDVRLARLGIDPDEKKPRPLLKAALRFAMDWEAAGLDPRITANMEGQGGGATGVELHPAMHPKIDARNRVHAAQGAMRPAGAKVVVVVESIVIRGATLAHAATTRYTDPTRHNVEIGAYLACGLALLANHYDATDAAKRSARLERVA